jgi:hypothetical protein
MGRFITFAMIASLAACGGGGKGGDTTPDPDEGGGDAVDDGQGSDGDDGMIPPERMDEIKTALDRKRNAATRCLTEAIDAGELDKNARGAVTVGFVIAPSGQPRDVQVLEASIDSKLLHGCVTDLVSGMTFPELPHDLDWSYTFAFEAF